MVVAIPSRAPPKNKGRAISVLSIKLPIRCGREDREIKLSDLGSWPILLEFIPSDRGSSARGWKVYVGFGLHRL